MAQNQYENFNSLSIEIRFDRKIAYLACKYKTKNINYTNPTFKDDKEFILKLIKSNPDAIYYTSDRLKQDKELVLNAINTKDKCGLYCIQLSYINLPLKLDRDIVLAIVSKDGESLYDASDIHKNDKEIVLAAVTNYGKSLRYASENLKADKKVVLTAMMYDEKSFKFASEQLKANKEIVLDIVSNYGTLLKYVSVNLKADKDIIVAAVCETGYAFKYAHIDIKMNKQFIIELIKTGSNIYKYIFDEYKSDKELTLLALKQYGLNLEYTNFKEDNELCKIAVRQDTNAIQFCINPSDKLCLYAVKKNGYVFKYLPEILRSELKFIVFGLYSSSDTLDYICGEYNKYSLEEDIKYNINDLRNIIQSIQVFSHSRLLPVVLNRLISDFLDINITKQELKIYIRAYKNLLHLRTFKTPIF